MILSTSSILIETSFQIPYSYVLKYIKLLDVSLFSPAHLGHMSVIALIKSPLRVRKISLSTWSFFSLSGVSWLSLRFLLLEMNCEDDALTN